MKSKLRWALASSAVAAALIAVFAAYLRPSLIVALGNQIWSCF